MPPPLKRPITAPKKTTQAPPRKARRDRFEFEKRPRHLRAQLPWPESVPVLTADDLADTPLWTWLGLVFPEGEADSPEETMAELAWQALAAAQATRQPLSLAEFAGQNGRAAAARLWNLAMSRLGYLEDKS